MIRCRFRANPDDYRPVKWPPNPCVDCGNTFVEIFGEDGKGFGKGWWCGCKPCSKRDPGKDHERGGTRDAAIDKWNAKNPLPPTTSGREGERG